MQYSFSYHKDHRFYEDDHKSIYSPRLKSLDLFAAFDNEMNFVVVLSFRITKEKCHSGWSQDSPENSFAYYLVSYYALS
jgi:hypothetical protein